MKIDLTCPIELRSYTLKVEESGAISAELSFFNLSVHDIMRFDATACWLDSVSGHCSVQSFRAEPKNFDARGTLYFTLVGNDVFHADQLEIHFNRVHFCDDAPEWLGGENKLFDVPELVPEREKDLAKLQRIAGADAFRFPKKEEDHWFCVCGRANRSTELKCMRCLRSKKEVFTRFVPEEVLFAAEEAPADAQIVSAAPAVRKPLFPLFRRTFIALALVVALMMFGSVSKRYLLVQFASVAPTLASELHHAMP